MTPTQPGPSHHQTTTHLHPAHPASTPLHLGAVDLGASSGRVIVGTLADGRIDLTETARFPNGPVPVPTALGERLYWDVLSLWREIRTGLAAGVRDIGPLASVGIDTWAVDYGLLDVHGALLGNPASYRSARTRGTPARLFEAVPAGELYAVNGLQVQDFNTVFQLMAEAAEGDLARACSLLLLPDLLGYWLTGRGVAEVTNASTTGLVDASTRRWSSPLLDRLRQAHGLGLDVSRLLPWLVEPGTVVGPVRPEVLDLFTAEGTPTPLVAVGSHDTASAVASVPATGTDFAYVSCGTWSLVGLELDRPVLTEASRTANFTNELGVDATVRYLKNVMGLWVFNEAVRTWREQGLDMSFADLDAAAAVAPPLRTVVDVNDDVFFAPGDMAARIDAAAARTGQPTPRSVGEYVRCIDDSLALAYRRAIRQAATLADHPVRVVHMVGGGIRNRLLCQLTADATGLPVTAGPIEGTALGNLVVQARAVGALSGGLTELREVVRASCNLTDYSPQHAPGRTPAHWDEAERRIFPD